MLVNEFLKILHKTWLKVEICSKMDFDPLQFGFKQKSSCSHALFTLKTIVDHYMKSGTTVTVCALDMSILLQLLFLLMDR